MRIHKLFLLGLLIFGLLLSACLPETAPEEPQETIGDDSSMEEIPVEEAPVEDTPYPAPEIVELGEETPYPDPGTDTVVEDGFTQNPYPALEIVAGISDVDLSDVIQPVEFAVQPNDRKLSEGRAFLERSLIVVKDDGSKQVELLLVGNLPTPCNSLRVVSSDVNASGNIDVTVYSVSDPEKICAMVLQPFTAVVPLEGLAEGAYSISINGKSIGEFKIP